MMSAVLNKILMVVGKESKSARLEGELSREGFVCVVAEVNNDALSDIFKQKFNLILINFIGSLDTKWAELNLARLRKNRIGENIPIIALIPENMIDNIDRIESPRYIDDFVVEPYCLKELIVRINRLCRTSNKLNNTKITKCGDLIIDSDKCEVYLNGKEISLTFKEYELLKFLAANKGKVFTRDTLLNEVWGYEYYGGDRTVDVHIRRLRNKIEDSQHIFIDTVRNIGYKFREENYSPSSEHSFLLSPQHSSSLCAGASYH